MRVASYEYARTKHRIIILYLKRQKKKDIDFNAFYFDYSICDIGF